MSRFFIIGSGFTKSIVASAPLNNDLLGVMSGNGNESAREIQARYGDDIEIALTKLDLDISMGVDSAHLKDLRKGAELAISSFFKTFRVGAIPDIITAKPWVHSFITSAISPGDVVVSLNYDCLFEGIADTIGLWSSTDGYGITSAGSPPRAGKGDSPIVVLKLHGSENFYRQAALGHDEINVFSYEADESLFPMSAKGRHTSSTNGNVKAGLIAPSYVKIYPSVLINLFLKAVDAVENATRLVLIGCSVRKEDQLLHTLIWRFILGNYPENMGRIIIVDPRAPEIFERLNSIFEYPITSIGRSIDKSLEAGWGDLVKCLNE